MTCSDDVRESSPKIEQSYSKVPESSYSQILKSSSIIGGAQIINMVLGLIRTKFVAILIGPSGVGLLGIFQSISGLATTVAGLGIQTSGVREIARYHGAKDEQRVAEIAKTLRRVSWLTGTVGMLILMLLAPQISIISFGTDNYKWAIVGLAVTVLLGNIAGGQSALIQGTQRIGDLARTSILSALFGTLVSVGFYSSLGIEGIVPALVMMSMTTLAISAYYTRRLKISSVQISWQESWSQSGTMIKFGIAMAASGAVGAAVSYFTRVLIIREIDLQAAGVFTAAFSVSAMFVQFVLGAMGSDFYPRLTAISHDHNRMSKLINEQTEIGLLLAFPGLLGTLVLAPYVLTILYSKDFAEAGGLLTWFIVGCMGRVLSWPLGFSLLAKGQGGLFFATESVFHCIHLALVWIGIQAFGLVGSSVAFAVIYLFYTLAMVALARKIINFTWSNAVYQQLVWMVPLTIATLINVAYLPTIVALPVGLAIGLIGGIKCLRQLTLRLGQDHKIPRLINRCPGGGYLLRGLWHP
ncbi:MAG: O-antigen translocase [Pirellula sp.]|nr:O-antigen translocase [Pirellula sp.]